MLDERMSLHRVRVRGKKWLFPLFTLFIDITIAYAWLFCQNGCTNDDISLLTTPRKLALSFLSEFFH